MQDIKFALAIKLVGQIADNPNITTKDEALEVINKMNAIISKGA